jgi:uncharacterized protein (UPF0303 family)
MAMADDIAAIVAQEKALVFDRFDEAAAYELGAALRRRGLAEALPIVIDIRLWDRPLFYAALPGSTAANADWARRKRNSVEMFHKSTYRMNLEQGGQEQILPPRYGLSADQYAIAGGGFPIVVKGVGAIGVVAVSGLPQRSDHELVVAVLAETLGQDPQQLALPATD